MKHLLPTLQTPFPPIARGFLGPGATLGLMVGHKGDGAMKGLLWAE